MRRSTLAICALLMVATSGCDQIDTAKAKLKLAWDKLRGRSTTQSPPPAPVRPATDTAATRVTAGQEQTRAQHSPPPPAPPGQAFTPDRADGPHHTGAVKPGLGESEGYGA